MTAMHRNVSGAVALAQQSTPGAIWGAAVALGWRPVFDTVYTSPDGTLDAWFAEMPDGTMPLVELSVGVGHEGHALSFSAMTPHGWRFVCGGDILPWRLPKRADIEARLSGSSRAARAAALDFYDAVTTVVKL